MSTLPYLFADQTFRHLSHFVMSSLLRKHSYIDTPTPNPTHPSVDKAYILEEQLCGHHMCVRTLIYGSVRPTNHSLLHLSFVDLQIQPTLSKTTTGLFVVYKDWAETKQRRRRRRCWLALVLLNLISFHL